MRFGRVVILAIALALAFSATQAFAARPVKDIPIDQSHLLKEWPAPRQLSPAEAEAAVLASGEPYLHEGREPDLVLTLFDWDPAHAGEHVVPFWIEASGNHSDIYVAWNDLTPPPTSSQQNHTITPAQIQSMSDEFDARIWASDVFHFGNYKPRRPADQPEFDGTRAGIFVYNIRDEAYWSSYRFYIAGYFWGGLNDELGLNAIFIDSYDWANRTGPDSARPYLYEATIAHEFQHLIHNDVDGNEDSFVDEGMADLAEQFIYGTETTASHIGDYLYFHRDSLIDWKGELFDYGNAVLWTDYLWERAGGDKLMTGGSPLLGRVKPGYDPFSDDPEKFVDPGDRFVWELIHHQGNGLESTADLLGGRDVLEQTHRDFTLANLLDGRVDEPEWNYRNLVLGGADSEGYSIDDGIAYYQSNVNGNMPPTRKNVRRRTAVEPWGAYYRTFGGPEPGVTMAFSGPEEDGILAYSAPYEWYSGLGNMLQLTLERSFDVAEGDELSFMTWFDIEEDWDYGYVEASSDGENWSTLPQLTALRVGDTNKFGSSAWEGPGGFTGSSGGWRQARFELSGFTGSVRIRFRYATDEAANGQGWYVDDIGVGAQFDPVDSTDGWTTNGWLFTNGLQNNDWTCDAFVPYSKAKKDWYELTSVVPVAGPGAEGSAKLDTTYLKSGKIYGIVSNRPDGTFASNGRLTSIKGK